MKILILLCFLFIVLLRSYYGYLHLETTATWNQTTVTKHGESVEWSHERNTATWHYMQRTWGHPLDWQILCSSGCYSPLATLPRGNLTGSVADMSQASVLLLVALHCKVYFSFMRMNEPVTNVWSLKEETIPFSWKRFIESLGNTYFFNAFTQMWKLYLNILQYVWYVFNVPPVLNSHAHT